MLRLRAMSRSPGYAAGTRLRLSRPREASVAGTASPCGDAAQPAFVGRAAFGRPHHDTRPTVDLVRAAEVVDKRRPGQPRYPHHDGCAPAEGSARTCRSCCAASFPADTCLPTRRMVQRHLHTDHQRHVYQPRTERVTTASAASAASPAWRAPSTNPHPAPERPPLFNPGRGGEFPPGRMSHEFRRTSSRRQLRHRELSWEEARGGTSDLTDGKRVGDAAAWVSPLPPRVSRHRLWVRRVNTAGRGGRTRFLSGEAWQSVERMVKVPG